MKKKCNIVLTRLLFLWNEFQLSGLEWVRGEPIFYQSIAVGHSDRNPWMCKDRLLAYTLYNRAVLLSTNPHCDGHTNLRLYFFGTVLIVKVWLRSFLYLVNCTFGSSEFLLYTILPSHVSMMRVFTAASTRTALSSVRCSRVSTSLLSHDRSVPSLRLSR